VGVRNSLESRRAELRRIRVSRRRTTVEGDVVTRLTRDLTIRAVAASALAFALAALLMIGGLGAFASAHVRNTAVAASARSAPSPPPPPETLSMPVEMHETPRLLEGESRTALQGDEVSDAIATYGIDGSGNLYEVHSPQTEVPKLGRPTT
jgi:hypothetical protein